MPKPLVYQLFVRLFGNKNETCVPHGTREQNGCGTFADVTDEALTELRALGVTHVWYTGLLRHATRTAYPGLEPQHHEVVKGKAGSPYAIVDYFDVDPDLALNPAQRLLEFRMLIDRTHAAGLKVIIDFVPNHVARQYHPLAQPQGIPALGAHDDTAVAFAPDNNFYYLPGEPFVSPEVSGGEASYHELPARATGNDVFSATPSITDWYETIKLNYGRDYATGQLHADPIPNTWLRMREIIAYWAAWGVDGFRCDMVELVPLEFWQWLFANRTDAYQHSLFIAECYTPSNYPAYLKAGFDWLYDKSGLYDAIADVVYERGSTLNIQHSLEAYAPFAGRLLKFTENHDEVRLASRHFGQDPAMHRPAWALAALASTCPTMLYFGQEVGETGDGTAGYSGDDGRSTIFDYWHAPQHQQWMNGGAFDGGRLNTSQRQLRKFFKDVNALTAQPAIAMGSHTCLHPWNAGQSWDYDERYLYAFLRQAEGQTLLVLCHFERTRLMEPRLVLPPALCDGTTDETQWQLRPLLGDGPQRSCTSADIRAGKPLHLVIEPLQAQVYAWEKVG